MRYRFLSSALRGLKRLEAGDQERILNKIDFFFNQLDPLAFAEPLKDKELGDYRFRVGDFRIIFDLKDEAAIILLIGNRKDIYR